MNTSKKTFSIVLTALFTALTVIATNIRVPMPAAIGSPFVHLGNSLVLLSILLLGFKHGAFAGGLGLAIFDLLNGFATEAPYFFVEAFIVGACAIPVFHYCQKKFKIFPALVLTGLAASIAKLIMTFLKGIVTALIAGTNFSQAILVSSTTLYVTFINCCITIIVVTLAYVPLKKVLSSKL